MNKKNIKPIIFMTLLFVACITIGTTIAYYTSSDTFNNSFNTGTYDIETQERFVSPDNWTPGTTTPKEIVVTNKGSIDAAVKVCFRQSWVDKNDNSLSLKAPLQGNNSTNAFVALLNFASGSDKKWLEDCSNDYANKYCFYYYKKLGPNESTSKLLESVTFNPNVTVGNTRNCETVDGVTTCRTTFNGYSGGTYTLDIDIETVQYDQYQNVFGNVTAKKNGTCSALNIVGEVPTYRLSYLIPDDIFIKDSELNQYDLTYADCSIVYVGEEIDENKYHRCYYSILIDSNRHEEGDLVEFEAFSVRFQYGTSHYENGEWVYEYNNDNWLPNMNVNFARYEKNYIDNYGYTYNEDDDVVMNFTNVIYNNWNDGGYIGLRPPLTFTMPNHDVLIQVSTPRD